MVLERIVFRDKNKLELILLLALVGVSDPSTDIVIWLIEFVFGDVASFGKEVGGS